MTNPKRSLTKPIMKSLWLSFVCLPLIVKNIYGFHEFCSEASFMETMADASF